MLGVWCLLFVAWCLLRFVCDVCVLSVCVELDFVCLCVVGQCVLLVCYCLGCLLYVV